MVGMIVLLSLSLNYSIGDKSPIVNNRFISFPYAIRRSAGVDLDAAGALGVKVIWALSLPGKVAPLTAAGAIKTAIYNILSELGV